MDAQPHVFRAMVFRLPRNARWYAECLDLSLAVARSTPEEAIDALQEQVDLHAGTVLQEQLPTALLDRPAPRSHWLLYWSLVATANLRALAHLARNWRTLQLTAYQPTHA